MMTCAFPYPVEADAVAAACCLYGMASGSSPFEASCAAHCGWVIQGFLQREVVPCPDCDPATKAKLLEACQPFVDRAAGNKIAAGVDFNALLQLILTLLQAWLRQPARA